MALRAVALAVCVALFLAPVCARAQAPGPALLVADSLVLDGDGRLIATGAVEAFYDGITLSAARIVYDRATDRLEIEGPVRLTDTDGRVTLLADAATLDPGLQNGLLTGARAVLDNQLQIAAVAAERIDGRYTVLDRVALSSCQVCDDGRPPLWQIRAQRVVHDQEARQIYVDAAQLRVLDLPVAYIPRLRLPDPTLARARGFLVPTLRSSSLLGLGVKLPYFVPIGPHQDITLTPYLSAQTRTLEYRYRRALRTGRIEVEGAVGTDTLGRDGARGYVFATGAFGLPRDFRLSFDLKAVSDAAYLNDYGISSTDRIDSTLALSRTRRDTLIDARAVYVESLRDSTDNDTQPSGILDIRTERRLFPARIGGELRLAAEAHGHRRASQNDTDGPDADSDADGRDVTRLSAEARWQNRWTLPVGLRAGLTTHLWADRIVTRQDAAAEPLVSRLTPGAAAELRWPLARTGPGGGRTLLEPVVQLGWIGGTRPGNANDESSRVEFDEASLLDTSRFPSGDRRDHGTTLAAGLRWAHQAPQGWQAALTLGQVWRETPDADYTQSSGLSGTESDLLVAGRFANENGLSILARGLFGTDGDFNKAEARADWTTRRLDLGASYVLLLSDPAETRDRTQSEWSLDAGYRINSRWATATDWRYDLADRRLDRVGLGLQYRNECVEVALSATRRLASSTNLDPSTDFSLTVALLGFSTGGSAKETLRSCSP
jgi:LPS-assembly protein